MNNFDAAFKVIKEDHQGSGIDYSGHLGQTVTNARRCCKNCQVIFGTIGTNTCFGPFILGELEPLNDAAKNLLDEISKRNDVK